MKINNGALMRVALYLAPRFDGFRGIPATRSTRFQYAPTKENRHVTNPPPVRRMFMKRRRDPRRIIAAPACTAYLIALTLQPVPSGPFRAVAVIAAGAVMFCVVTVTAVRFIPGVDSWADVGLRRATPLRWWAAGLLTAATSLGYVAVEWISQQVGGAVTVTFGPAPVGIPALSTPNPAELPADIIRSVHTAVLEELLYFAVPLAIGALAWRRAAGRWRWFPIRVEHRLIVCATGLAIVGLRCIGHLYWGFPAVLILVVPWMAGAWLMFRLSGTVWPLIIGHTVYDVFVFTAIRAPDVHWLAPTSAVVIFAGTCVFTGPAVLPLAPFRMFRSAPAGTTPARA